MRRSALPLPVAVTTEGPRDSTLGALQNARAGTLDGLLGGLTRPGPSAAWSDAATTQARLAAVVAHQNAQRSAKGLPLLTTDVPSKLDGANVSLTMPTGYDGDETTAGAFNTWGDTLMRAVYGDLFSLNEVYTFEGAKLTGVTSYAEWLIQQLPGDTVTLHRKMSEEEEQQWKSGDASGVGSDWGHGVPVVHFSTDHDQTSAAGDGPTLSFEVPKAELVAAAKAKALWSSATELPEPNEGRAVISELVLSADRVRGWKPKEQDSKPT